MSERVPSVRWPCLVWIGLATIGCGDGTATPEATDGAVAESLLYEPSWNEQVAAVRDGRSTEIRVSAPVADMQLAHLGDGCEHLTVLVLDRSSVADADLEVLRSLPHLRWIKLTSPIGDAGAETLSQCPALEIINLPGSTLSDRGLRALAGLERLELFRVRAPAASTAGLHALTNLERLRFLHLLDVPLTADGLAEIATIDTLESFYIDGDFPASDADLRALIAARPDLHVHIDQQHLFGDPNTHPHE